MSVRNVELVRKLFKAVEERNLTALLSVYDSNIVIHEATFLPYGGTYFGRRAAIQHGREFVKIWDKFQSADEKCLDPRIIDTGDHVVVLWRLMSSVESGNKINVPAVVIYKVVGSKVKEARMFYSNTSEILEFINR